VSKTTQLENLPTIDVLRIPVRIDENRQELVTLTVANKNKSIKTLFNE